MADVDDKTQTALQEMVKILAALKDTLLDVGERVNRLQEWVELELYVLKLANTFEQFSGEVRRAFGVSAKIDLASMPPDKVAAIMANLPLLVNLWENCRRVSLTDLELFVDDLRHLNTPLVTDPASDLKLKEWIDELRRHGDKIQQALTSSSFQEVKDNCDAFDECVKRRVGLHRQRMKKEIGVLAEVSVQLRTRLDVSVPA